MDAPTSPVSSGRVGEPSIQIVVWIAFAACAFLFVLMSGVSGLLLAIIIQRGGPEEAVAPPEPQEVQTGPAAAKALRQRAMTAIEAGDYDRAVALSTQGLAVAPGDSDLQDLLKIASDLRDRPVGGILEDPAAEDASAAAAARARNATATASALTADPEPVVTSTVETPAPRVVPRDDAVAMVDDAARRPPAVLPPAKPAPPAAPPVPVVPGPSTLYVYLPSAVKPRAIQETLQAKLSGVTVTAFGSFRDFKQAMDTSPAHAVIAPRAVLDALGLPTNLQGRDESGSADERYLLLGPRSLSNVELQSSVIGMVNVAGRDSSAEFVATVLDTTAAVQVKRVTEESDLLPLLQFGAADAILLPETAARTLMGSTQMHLMEMEVASGAGLPAVSILDNPRRAQIEESIRGLGTDVNAKVGVNRWGE